MLHKRNTWDDLHNFHGIILYSPRNAKLCEELQSVWRNTKVCEEIQKRVTKYKSVWRNTKVCEEIQKCAKKYKVWATSTMSLGIPRHSLSHTLMPSAFPYLVCILTTSSHQSSSSSSLPSSSFWCKILGTIREGWWYGFDWNRPFRKNLGGQNCLNKFWTCWAQ